MNTMAHEDYRFNTMNEKQLFTRLGRITDPIKLNNFIRVAHSRGMLNLESAARNRYSIITGREILWPPVIQKQAPSPIVPVVDDEGMGKRKLKL